MTPFCGHDPGPCGPCMLGRIKRLELVAGMLAEELAYVFFHEYGDVQQSDALKEWERVKE